MKYGCSDIGVIAWLICSNTVKGEGTIRLVWGKMHKECAFTYTLLLSEDLQEVKMLKMAYSLHRRSW